MTHIILLTVWCQQSVCVLVGRVGEKSEGKECMKEIRERFPTASEEKMTAECKCTKRSTAEKPHSWRERDLWSAGVGQRYACGDRHKLRERERGGAEGERTEVG